MKFLKSLNLKFIEFDRCKIFCNIIIFVLTSNIKPVILTSGLILSTSFYVHFYRFTFEVIKHTHIVYKTIIYY